MGSSTRARSCLPLLMLLTHSILALPYYSLYLLTLLTYSTCTHISGASLLRKNAVARRSFFSCSPTLPGQQQENSKLLPGGQVSPTSFVRQTVVAAYLVRVRIKVRVRARARARAIGLGPGLGLGLGL